MNDPISVSFYSILFYAMHFLKKKSIEKRIRSRSFNNYVDKMRAEGVKNIQTSDYNGACTVYGFHEGISNPPNS